MSTTVAEPLTLTAQDRCDRCGAAAQARAELVSGLELLFCRHHLRENQDKLLEGGAQLQVVAE